MRTFVASLLLSALFAAPALAQNQPDKPFQGPSATVIVGVDHASASGRSGTGVVYGGQLAYDLQSGSTVFGIEGEITGASTRYCYSGAVVAGDRFCDKANRDLYIGGRLGKVVGDSTLIYVKAGYTNARDDFEYRDGGTGANNYSGDGVQGGVRGGIGVEMRIGRNFTVKAEYRYSNYSNSDYDRHQGVVGVGFRF